MAQLSVLLLGSFQVLLDGNPATGFESDKVRALLAYLAVERDRPHRREALAGLLWPDYPESTARASLRNALFNLRGVIGDHGAEPPCLLITPQTIQCNPGGDFLADASALMALMAACERHKHPRLEDCAPCIERLEQAVALYRGSFLEGFSLEDSAPFEEWAALKREQLQHQALAGLERLAACYERRGEPERALQLARRQLELDALQEQAHRQVMRLLALSGRRGEALAQYEACVRILAAELDAAPDAETQALRERIRDGNLASPSRAGFVSMGPMPKGSITAGPIQAFAHSLRSQEGPSTSSTASLPQPLHQLPPPPADFVGREKELHQLRDAIESQGARILGVRGLGGVGKTALALVLAERLAESYPDAQLYIEMRGTDLHPMDPTQAMAHIIRSFYPLAILPGTEVALRGLYRSALWGRRALILLDNVRDRAQVEPLLPPESCLLIVTSRWRFALPGLHPLDLEAQPMEQAAQMLRAIAPRINWGQARELAQVCGGLPLALRVAGSALAEREDLPVEDYLGELRAAQDRLPREMEPVESSLATSDALLGEALRPRWYALSIFPDTLDRAAAAAVWGLPVAQAQSSLGELVRYSLLSYDRERGRYRLYDLCRVYIASRLGEDASQEARSRHAAHYAEVLKQAHQGYLRGKEDMIRGLALFDLERRNIEVGQAWAAWHADGGKGDVASGDATSQAARLCMLYANTEYGFLDLRLNARSRLAWQEAGLNGARRLQDRTAEVNCLTLLGFAHRDLGDSSRSMQCYEQALDLARQIGDRRAEALLLGFVGKLYEDRGQMRRALEYYEQFMGIAQEIGDRRREKIALNGLGTAHAALGEYQQAIDYHERNLVIQRELGDRRGEGYNLGGLARAYHMLGQIDRALVHYQEQLDVARDIGYGEEVSKALRGLGLAHLAQGDPRQAVSDLEESLKAAREISSHREEGSTLVGMGEAYTALGEKQRAASYYAGAMQLAFDKGDRSIEGDALWSQSLVADRLGDRVRAVEMAEGALAVYEQIEHYRAEQVRQRLAGWRKEGEAVLRLLHQLPPSPADFVGREEELRRLLDAVQSQGVRIVAVRGLGGMGKTSLALRLAERLAEHYPDGQLYIEMHGLDAGPFAPAEAMAHVIRSYHPQAQLPTNDNALGALYRSILQGQRVLILLDNARDRAQVEPLLPPASCLLLITSRWRFALPGLHTLDLQAQPPDQATQMLRAIAPRLSQQDAGELARACGRLPLALRVAGSALAEWEDLPVDEYLGRLRAAQGRLPEELIAVESSLALSDALLSEALQARWYALAIFPETFDRAGAQAVWGPVSAAEAQGTLSELLRYSLIEYDAQGQRYRLHDLCRAYAAARLGPQAAGEACARHAAHYAQIYREADRLYVVSGFDSAVLKHYDREWPNILAGQAYAASRLTDTDDGGVRALSRTSDYLDYVPPALGDALVLIRLLVIRLDARRRVDWWQTGLGAARQVGDRHAEMRCLLWLAMAYRELGEFRLMLPQVEQALVIAQQLGDRGGEGAALHQLSVACSVLEGPAAALTYSERCLAITHELGWSLIEALVLRFLAHQYLELEQPQRGLDCAQRASTIAREIEPAPPHVGLVLQVSGWVYTEAGHPRRGLEDLQSALTIIREWGSRLWEGVTLVCIGRAHRALGEADRAREHFERALAIGREIDARASIAEALDELGQLWAARDGTGANTADMARAVEYYEQALAVWDEVGSPLYQGRTLWNMSVALDALGERPRAIAAAEKALALLGPLRHPAAERVRQKLAEWRGRQIAL